MASPSAYTVISCFLRMDHVLIDVSAIIQAARAWFGRTFGINSVNGERCVLLWRARAFTGCIMFSQDGTCTD